MKSSSRPVIIPIASGKGGVGKSVFAASLAISLAKRGEETVAVDLDLGGSNLHSYLGLSNTNPGIGDYLKRGLNRLSDLIVPGPVEKLGFLPGDGKTPFMANIPARQRFFLLDELRQLPARYIVIDLGAGSSINTMNFFGLSNNGIIVTTLDTPAIMNALVFLRNFMFANIISLAKENPAIRKKLLDLYRRPAERENLTVETILAEIARTDQPLATRIGKRCSYFQPRLVFNMGDRPEDLAVAEQMAATMKKNLSMASSTLGLIHYDDAVRRAARKAEAFLPTNPDSAYSRCLQEIVERLLKGI